MLPPLFVILVICLLCFLVGTTELAVGIVEFMYFDMIPKQFVYVGSFWAGCFPILGAFAVFIGMRKQYHKALIAGWVFALIGAGLSIAGTVLDGMASVQFASLTACAQVTTLSFLLFSLFAGISRLTNSIPLHCLIKSIFFILSRCLLFLRTHTTSLC